MIILNLSQVGSGLNSRDRTAAEMAGRNLERAAIAADEAASDQQQTARTNDTFATALNRITPPAAQVAVRELIAFLEGVGNNLRNRHETLSQITEEYSNLLPPEVRSRLPVLGTNTSLPGLTYITQVAAFGDLIERFKPGGTIRTGLRDLIINERRKSNPVT